jgi:hypothetical protein
VDWTKVDAALAGELDRAGDGDVIAVFVHVDLDTCDRDENEVPLAGQGEVRTTTVTVAQVADLTDQAWVRHLRWSGPLRLLDGDATG